MGRSKAARFPQSNRPHRSIPQSSNSSGSRFGFLFFAFLNFLPHQFFLVMPGVVTWLTADGRPHPFGMFKIPMAAFAAAIEKPCLFQVGNQLSDLARHR